MSESVQQLREIEPLRAYSELPATDYGSDILQCSIEVVVNHNEISLGDMGDFGDSLIHSSVYSLDIILTAAGESCF